MTWNENIDFTQINALIDVQERCLNLMEKEDIKQINKRLKKQKVTDIIEILDEN